MDKKLLHEAMSSLELVDIYLNNSNLSRNDDFTVDDQSDDLLKETRLSVTALILEPVEKHDENSVVNAKVEFGARYARNSEKEEDVSVLAEMVAEYIVVYQVSKPLRDEALQEFLKHNVVHNVWPFWREYLLNTTRHAKLPDFVLPLNKKLSLELNRKD